MVAREYNFIMVSSKYLLKTFPFFDDIKNSVSKSNCD